MISEKKWTNLLKKLSPNLFSLLILILISTSSISGENIISGKAKIIDMQTNKTGKLFASKLMKETNVYDRNIDHYLKGRNLEQLLEGDRIKEQIRLSLIHI